MDLFRDKTPEGNQAISDFFNEKLASMGEFSIIPIPSEELEAWRAADQEVEAYEAFEGVDRWAQEINAANKAKGFDSWAEINEILSKWAMEAETLDRNLDIVPHLDRLEELLYPVIEPMRRAQMIALIHSELSEMLEADRKDSMDSHLPDRKGWEVEGADVFIRLLDCMASTGHADTERRTFGKTIGRKSEYNARRPRKHGKKY